MKKHSDNQTTLLNIILQDSQRIPPFIDPKLSFDVVIWRNIQSIYASIIHLIAPTFLSKYQIEIIDFEIQADISNIVDVADARKQNLIIAYLNDKINTYAELALQLELYEAAANIKIYQTL